MKLEILEKLHPGVSGYDGPFISVHARGAYLSKNLVKFLEIKKDDTGLFARNAQTGTRSEEYDWFFTIIPLTSNIKGYAIRFYDKLQGTICHISSKSFIDRGLPAGRYILQDPIYNNDTGFDWYPMLKI